ncbi:hypothetical protein J5N97_011891 [Dioscorea zingiberensis]|uniref:Uncharacterized protein n=1 Tax=Dioscorea zingiberensis TaxID=325984 RepID=A0A9D5D1X6_9LILI|nr:hypothetical protein J5N97_011891 [Dioscorea zingiberensis]
MGGENNGWWRVKRDDRKPAPNGASTTVNQNGISNMEIKSSIRLEFKKTRGHYGPHHDPVGVLRISSYGGSWT